MSAAAVLRQLADVCAGQGPTPLAARLRALQELVRDDLSSVERALAGLAEAHLAQRSAHHLLRLGGKRLRPLCALLAARSGPGPCGAAVELATAVELVHSATLLHDDVVDLGEQRRGLPAARVVYGNAASIFAGDWLLIEAVRRVLRARVPGALELLLDVIDEMIAAEAAQLAGRGRVHADRGVYLRIVEGKTAALFRWALYAGGRAGGLGEAGCQALGAYGVHLGVAFQAVDDLLDLTGDERVTGKALFADLREGKLTLPLILAAEREPSLLGLLGELAAAPGDGTPPPETLRRQVLLALTRTGALAGCRDLAQERARLAARCLEPLPPSPARDALGAIAEATVTRDH